MPELLLEILSEEIPARMQARAAADLKRLVTDGLKQAGLDFQSAESYVTPRRLTLVVDGLPEKQPDVSEEKRGPKVDAPEQAINGFRGSLPEGAVIEKRETPKGTFLFALVESKGAATADVLIRLVSEAMANLPWPKSMRWASYPGRWVRPVHSIVCLFDGEVVPVVLGPITAGYATVGHRFLAPDLINLLESNFADYKQKLLDAKVMLDPAERRTKIEAKAKEACERAGVTLKDDPGLLDEVTGLVEWPVVLMGTIDDQFMDLPDEVLSTSMRSHQKYFSTLDKDGKLANKFIVVANTKTNDGGKQVVAGNERVLRARLSDAKFFWDQDQSLPLTARLAALHDRVFHAQLGTIGDKVERIKILAGELCRFIVDSDKEKARLAATLAKADLSTGMVGEFPELQGVMGRYYALNDGENEEVANAIAEHYSPVGPSDKCPREPISVAVALSDKIDTLVGFFSIGEKPTGSKDPYALRRAALGVIRIVLEGGFFSVNGFPLKEAFRISSSTYSSKPDVADELFEFFMDRMRVHLREAGSSHDFIEAVMSGFKSDDLGRIKYRVGMIESFASTEDGANLLTAYRRAANILRIEEKKDGKEYSEPPSRDLFVLPEENDLLDALDNISPLIEKSQDSGHWHDDESFSDMIRELGNLRKPVDAFFDKVTVNADDAALRVNRLKLLNGIRASLDGVADFSKIEGK